MHDQNGYVATINGASVELVSIGSNTYRARIEGANALFQKTGSGWIMTAQDGTTYTYGMKTGVNGSRQEFVDPKTGAMVFKWCLDKVVDKNGNYMTVSYVTPGDGQIYLSEINYAGNANVSPVVAPTNRVVFTTAAVTNLGLTSDGTSYAANYAVQTSRRLTAITTYASGNPVRQYALAYEQSPNSSFSHLISVTQTGYGTNGTVSLPQTAFAYQKPDQHFDIQEGDSGLSTHYTSGNNINLVGDFNGDGKADILSWIIEQPSLRSDCQVNAHVNVNISTVTSTGTATFAKTQWGDGTAFYASCSVLIDGNGNTTVNTDTPPAIFLGDFNGDGKTDVATVDNSGSIFVYLSTGTNFTGGSGSLWWNSLSGSNFPASQAIQYTKVGDFNGDGRADIISYPGYGNYFNVYLSNPSGRFDHYQWNSSLYFDPIYRFNFWLGDFNGDGKTDVAAWVTTGGDRLRIHISTGTNFVITGTTSNPDWPANICRDPWGPQVLLGDFNGDGKTDIAGWPWRSDGTYFNMHLSTGSAFVISSWTIASYPVYANPGVGPVLWLGDFNGDGKTDIAGWVTATNGNSIGVHYSTGSGFVNSQWTTSFNPYNIYTPPQMLMMAGDFNGDGRTDMVYPKSGTYGQKALFHLTTGVSPDLLSTINNGIGGTTAFAYAPSSRWHVQGETPWSLPFVLQTVSEKDVSDGRGNTMTTRYSYSGGKYVGSERDFRGFQTATEYQMNDMINNHYESMIHTTFIQDDPILKGKIVQQTSTSKEGSTRTVSNTWQKTPVSPFTSCDITWPIQSAYYWPPRVQGACFPYISTTITSVNDAASPSQPYVLTADYQYNLAVLKIASECKRGTNTSGTSTSGTICTKYEEYSTLGKPRKITVTDGSVVKSRKWMVYDQSGNLASEELCNSSNPGQDCGSSGYSQNPVTSYHYDGLGNMDWTTDAAGCTTNFDYDPDTKTFVNHKTGCAVNGITHVTTTVYDKGTGKLLTMTPPHLQSTGYYFEYQYDGLGRILHEIQPGPQGTRGFTDYEYDSFGNPSAQNVTKTDNIYDPVSQTTSAQVTTSFFDGLGRTYTADTTGFGGRLSVVDTHYDKFGRVVARSNPYYYQIDPVKWTTYAYDGFSRVIQATTPYGANTYTIYRGRVKDVINPRGFTTTHTYDAFQLLRATTDAGQPGPTTTYYEYDTLGNLTSVSRSNPNPQSGAVVTTMNYNSLSRKTYMKDPDMGEWWYTYWPAGSLKTQTTNTRTTTFSYDALSRISVKATPDDTVVYTYDDPAIPYSKGKLTRVSASNNSGAREYKEDTVISLDRMQRITRSRKLIRNDFTTVGTATINRDYDTAGRMTRLTYFPGEGRQKVITYSYDYHQGYTSGLIASIHDGTKNLVAYPGYNALGKPLSAVFPGNVKTDYTYDPDTTRLDTLITTGPSGTYQNLAYDFDLNGNLTSLTDNVVNGISHVYQYDSLDRLTYAAGTGTGAYTQSFGYDILGNITYKSDVGYYTYDYSNKPHAVRSAGGINFSYDYNGNMTYRKSSGTSWLDISWTADNKPASVKKNGSVTTTLTYDGNGQRVRKQGPNGTTLYFGELYEERGGTGIYHVFAGTTRIASLRTDGLYGSKDQYYHGNHLNSASVITDQNGYQKQKVEYYPYGTYRYTVPPGQYATWDFDATFPNVNYTFTDQEDDDEYGFYNFKARLYDPLIGRFISADSVVPQPGNLQAFNRYSYCVNNPVTYVDPSGNFFFMGIALFVTAAAVAASQGYGDTAVAAGIGGMLGGWPGAVIAAGANVFLNHTGVGRQLTQVVAREVFEKMGMSPQIAYMASSVTLNAALSWGAWGVYNAINGTPSATIQTDAPSTEPKNDIFLNEKNMGETGWPAGRNLQDTIEAPGGQSYAIVNEQGEIVGRMGKDGAFGAATESGIDHTAVVVKGNAGVFSSSNVSRFNIYGITSTCHQMANQAALQAGYSLTVNGATAGWFSYVTAAVYGPYGSAEPALSYFEAEENRERR